MRQLGRDRKGRLALLRNLCTALIQHERIVTTFARAMEVRSMAERLVTYAKKEDKLHGRRLANRHIFTKEAQSKLMNVLGPRYKYRDGGYTRVMKLSQERFRDKAQMAVIEYVDRPGEIRAARPPTSFQNQSIEQVMAAMGINDPDLVKNKDDSDGETLEGEVVDK